MTELERMKLEAEHAAVKAGRLNMQVRIKEMEDEIDRTKGHLEIQKSKEKEIEERLKEK